MEPIQVRDHLAGDRQIEQVIHPTHQCFDDAVELVLYLHTEEGVPAAQLRVVHAICLLPNDGMRFAHAWVERGSDCLFLGLYDGARVICTVPRHDYYRRLRVQERTKYTPRQVAQKAQRAMSHGPWKPQYLALTRQGAAAQTERDDAEPLQLV